MTDVTLLHEHRKGSDEAFAQIVRRHIDWIYGMALRRLRDPASADDVTQAVFVLLHRKSPDLPTDRAVVSWLHRTARYATLAAEKSSSRRRNHESQAAMLHSDITHPDDPTWHDLAPMLDELITQLPQEDREGVLLRYYRDMPYAEIAVELGTTAEGARKRIERAVEKLRGFAASRNVMMSSSAIAIYLASNVRIVPPAGLIATSTTAASAAAGSSVAGPSAGIVKGVSFMLVATKIQITAIAAVVAIVLMGQLIVAQSATPAAKASDSSAAPNPSAPFTNVRWQNNMPQVEVEKVWYDLTAINDLPVAEIVVYSMKTYGDIWQKRFAEDLVDVTNGMRKPLGATVKLQLRTLDTQQLVTRDVAMTTANRWETWGNLNGAPGLNLPAAGQRFEKLSPYSGIRWANETPQVQVDNVWYTLRAIDDIETEKIVAFSKTTYQGIWQKRINEDLVEVLTTMKHKPGDTVKLSLVTLDNVPIVIQAAAMTKENRRAVMEQLHTAGGEKPSL